MIDDINIKEIIDVFQLYRELLLKAGIDENDVLPEELKEYFAGETPSGDRTTLKDVLSNRWLLLHEIVELKHLKIKGHKISRNLVWEQYEDVIEAHLAATALELRMALEHNEVDWIKARIKLIPSWLEDSDMPERFRKACETLIKHYTIETSL
ncbi:hypothetical protein EU527_08805 [Candidatus Thorarchaeota archaeon]|nr:MAG: hypothetical protein EU527_08805 [Candidatus Thorarchaeota archaeon]